jgi:SAM-dependent methyltransferase
MRDWVLPLLRCLACSGTRLECRPSELRCTACGHAYVRRDDVIDFLYHPHPAIVREREAVHRIDREGGASVEVAKDIFKRLESGELTEQDLEQSAYTRAIAESRAQILEVFGREPAIPSGTTALEIGADTGWASSVLLKAGCRVIAIDITDHLFLAPDGASPNLCRFLADMNRVPLRDSSVDVVFAASCVHHSWDLGATFGEIARVLKPGGKAYLCGEPIPSLPRFVMGGHFGRKERSLGINETWIRRGTWLRQCRQAGLEPKLLFPALDERQLKGRLEKRRLPGILVSLLRPILPFVQVSVHLRAEKPEQS